MERIETNTGKRSTILICVDKDEYFSIHYESANPAADFLSSFSFSTFKRTFKSGPKRAKDTKQSFQEYG